MDLADNVLNIGVLCWIWLLAIMDIAALCGSILKQYMDIAVGDNGHSCFVRIYIEAIHGYSYIGIL